MKQNRIKIALLFFLVLITFMVVVQPVHAAGLVPCAGTEADPCTFRHLVLLVISIINLLLGLSWLVAIFYVFWGAWTMITAYGNTEGIEHGKKTFSNAVIGFFLIMVSYILINFVVSALTGKAFTFESILNFLPFPNRQ